LRAMEVTVAEMAVIRVLHPASNPEGTMAAVEQVITDKPALAIDADVALQIHERLFPLSLRSPVEFWVEARPAERATRTTSLIHVLSDRNSAPDEYRRSTVWYLLDALVLSRVWHAHPPLRPSSGGRRREMRRILDARRR